MGQGCSCVSAAVEVPKPSTSSSVGDNDDSHGVDHCHFDPVVYDMVRRSNRHNISNGQHHLLYKKGKMPLEDLVDTTTEDDTPQSTRLVLRKSKPEATTQIYAIRSCSDDRPEQRPPMSSSQQQPAQAQERAPQAAAQQQASSSSPDLTIDPYIPTSMMPEPKKKVADWVCVSEELDIYICDTGLSHAECDQLVQTTEQVCKGHYAAYTYAKQTLGCREFPVLAHACWEPVHRVTHTIWRTFPASQKLQLDDREPHIVKYDVTKKERQKLDMHTDKSEWTFLIALSDGCGLDYEGGGTYFEALDATVHVQRGHALIFPGKLRHCGQRITKGLRFLLVGFLVDKANQQTTSSSSALSSSFKDALPSQNNNNNNSSNTHHHHHHHQASMLASGDVSVDT